MIDRFVLISALMFSVLNGFAFCIEGTVHESVTFYGTVTEKTVVFSLYLPPGYDTSSDRYPVIYYLHGLNGSHDGGHLNSVPDSYETALAAGDVPPCILVFPDGYVYSMWADSYDDTISAETDVIQEIIPFVDNTYRTDPDKECRIITGFSMGGFGAAKFAAKYPDMFNACVIFDGALHTWQTLNDTRGEDPDIPYEVFNDDEEYYNQYSPHNWVVQNASILGNDMPFRITVGALTGYCSAFRDLLESEGISVDYIETGAPHNVEQVLLLSGEQTWRFISSNLKTESVADTKASAEGGCMHYPGAGPSGIWYMGLLILLLCLMKKQFGTFLVSITLTAFLISGCGSYEKENEGSSEAVFSMKITDHLGSLYNAYDWAGPVRDPFRGPIEMHTPDDYAPITVEEADAITAMVNERDVIMQIGGMGSAKPNPENPDLVNDKFAAYLDSVIADDGVSWRTNVTLRVKEVLAASSQGSNNVYWQIGNEINAESYANNIDLYFGTVPPLPGREQIIPYYVEYFFAPTVQGMLQAEEDTGGDVLITTGSIAGFSSGGSQGFLDSLLNYQITGIYAPELTGVFVYELIDIITIHYLMNSGTPSNPESWKDALDHVRDTWFPMGIKGVWSTEECGIRAAEDGAGASIALRVLTRYLGWIDENGFGSEQCRMFFYGTTAGPKGQQIIDSMSLVDTRTGGAPLQFYLKSLTQDNTVESYIYKVPALNSWLATVSVLGNDPVDVSRLPESLPFEMTLDSTVSAVFYGEDGVITPDCTFYAVEGGTEILFNETLTFERPETLLIWVTQQ